MGSKAAQTRRRLLKVARRLVFREGAGSLTLDLLAQEAGLSKGGVLYHFSSKRGLFEAVVCSFLDDFEEQVERLYQLGERPWLVAYLKASFPEQRVGLLREFHALFAIMALEPKLLGVAQERFEKWHTKAQEDGGDPVTAGLIRSAIDGLWYNEMFGLSLPEEHRSELLGRLETLARAEGG